MKKEVAKIFDDLDEYREFCKEQGFPYDEGDLYKKRTPWNLMERHKQDPNFTLENNWEKGAKILHRPIHARKK